MYQVIPFIQQQLRKRENPSNAHAMAAYMKTAMPFYGVKSADRRSIVKEALAKYPLQNQQEYHAVVQGLWDLPHREEKYAAIDIARTYKQYQTLQAVPLYEAMIRQGAWWDFVDDIAVHLIGNVLLQNQSSLWPIIDQWIDDPHMWIRRTALICQNKSKDRTDSKRLFSFCLQRANEKEFFIRKAIGWSLREYAKTTPQEVQLFVTMYKEQLSGLSYREATKRFAVELFTT